MKDSIKVKVDTVYIGVYDSSIIISGKQSQQQIILLQDKKKEPEKSFLEQQPWIGTLIFPIVIAAIGILLSYYLTKRKYNEEIKSLTTQINKTEAETAQIKDSYKPIVIATLQTIQDKLLNDKINGLKVIINLTSNFFDSEQTYHNGEGLDDYDDYLNNVFENFNSNNYNEFQIFINEYGYFYNKTSFSAITKLHMEITALHESVKAYNSRNDIDKTPSALNREDVTNILKLLTNVINAIRSELHLENTFIEDYIRENSARTE